MLTPEILLRLRSPEGAALLERARGLAADPFAAQRLRSEATPELAAAAVEQVRLRARAAAKFARAGEMWFTPALLEQASGETVSVHRAALFAALGVEAVGDLCCGLGGDALSLAARTRVLALDRDPLAVAVAQANAASLNLAGRVEVRRGEVPGEVPGLAAAWVDPGRRAPARPGERARRTRGVEQSSPSLSAVLSLRERVPSLGIKLSPAAAHEDLDALLACIPHDREVISVRGEAVEMVLWIGRLSTGAARRAVVLPSGAQLEGVPAAGAPVAPPGPWLLEPDPAVIRAGLVGNLTLHLGAWLLDPRLALVAADRPLSTPFGRLYRVVPPEPFSERALAARLRALGASDVVIKTRASAVRPEILRRRLRGVLKHGRPGVSPVVFVTRLGDRPTMIVGERFGPGTE